MEKIPIPKAANHRMAVFWRSLGQCLSKGSWGSCLRIRKGTGERAETQEVNDEAVEMPMMEDAVTGYRGLQLQCLACTLVEYKRAVCESEISREGGEGK